jgi:hypothetical protein
MQVAPAWLLQRSPNILLICGTSSVEHLRENLKAASLQLPRVMRSIAIAETSPGYCWKLVAEGLGQRRISAVVLRPDPPARKVQHSPSVEQ